MTAEEFVDGVKKYVMDAAVSDAMQVVVDPPGRQPPEHLVELSKWFAGVSQADREMIRRMMANVAHFAVFGLLVVLDSSRKVVDAPPGHFELCYVHDDDEGRDVLSGPKGAILHDLL